MVLHHLGIRINRGFRLGTLPLSKRSRGTNFFRGWRIWNRTQNVLNEAEGGKKSRRKRPPSEWIRQEVPELRTVSDVLWETVQQVNRRRGDSYAKRLGGLNRSEASRKYLFSGVLYCGICGDPYTVINGKAPNVRYGCPNHRFRKTCTNSVTILRTRLEQQLISALCARICCTRRSNRIVPTSFLSN